MATNPTTETAFGPAEYTVSASGSVSLTWPAGVTINRVFYPRANVYGEVRNGHHSAHVMLDRENWQDKPTSAALTTVWQEHARLAPLLATPERLARAQVEAAERELGYAERALCEAEAKEARARAVLEEARAELGCLTGGAA